ncbi:hypothetical protein LguiA_016370 [Lonicera macranthoides]
MMGTLRNSSSKLFPDKYRDRGGIGFFSTTHAQNRSLQLVLPFDHVNVSFSVSISLQPPKTTHLISPLSSLSSPDKQTDIEHEESEIEVNDQSTSVRVKFLLERECSFGQQFFIVGDDPMIGLWNPLNGLQLNWSDGHVWTVELDVPIGKSIKYKFLLKGDTGKDILWQPGPDRILQTWATNKTITVSEDWDNADLQKLAEEEPSSFLINTPISNPEKAIVAENLTQPLGSQANNIEEDKEDPLPIGDNGSAMNVKDMESKKDRGKMGSYEGVPVLVPGLTPLPIALTDDAEESTNEVVKNFCTDGFDGAGEAKVVKVVEMLVVDMDLKEGCENNSPNTKETTEMMFGDRQEQCQDEQAEKPQLAEELDQTNMEAIDNIVLENDIQWGRKTLQRFLSNLGIL